MIRLRPSGADEVLIKRVRDWYEPGPGVFITSTSTLFTPAQLFTGTTTGAWYDPSDTTTLFQDAAGTIPVTAVEQPVGRMLDKSGRGNHAFNNSGNSANFPVLQQDGTGRYYLAFNGNQWLQTNSIDFSYGDKMFVCAGVRKLSDNTYPVIAETFRAGATVFDSFSIHASQSSSVTGYVGAVSTTTTAYWSAGSSNKTAPTTDVVTVLFDSKATSYGAAVAMRIDSSSQTLSDLSSGVNVTTNNFGANPLNIGARAGTSLWFNGRLYQLVVAGKQASAAEITNTEIFINQKTGAY